MVAGGVNALGGDVRGVAAGRRIAEGDNAARLHRIGDDAVVGDIERDGVRRAGEGSRDRSVIAGMPFEAQIAQRLGRQLRRVGRPRRGSRGYRSKRRVIVRNPLGGIERLLAALGDDQRDRLANIADLALGQERLRREGEGLAGHRVGVDIGQQRLEAVGAHIVRGQDRQYPRHRHRRGGVDRPDLGMRVLRAQHHGVRDAVERQVVEIAAASSQKPQILAPLRRIADPGPNGHTPLKAVTGPRESGTVAAFSFQSFDHDVTGCGTTAPSTRISSTCSLKNERRPLIFGHSGIGSG